MTSKKFYGPALNRWASSSILLGFLHKCKHTRHTKRLDSASKLVGSKIPFARTTQGLFNLFLISIVILSYNFFIINLLILIKFYTYYSFMLFNSFFVNLSNYFI